MTTLVRPDKPGDDLDALRARVTEREAVLDQRATDADRITRELDMFAAKYKQQVGTLHEQLDQLELDIAEAELGELSKAVAAGTVIPNPTPPPSMPASGSAPRFSSDAVRSLFRDVARAIHPDLAGDERTRDRRHALMIEANRAYAMRDEEELRRILDAWERSPEAVKGHDDTAMRLRLERRLAQIEEHLARHAREFAELQASRLYELKAMVDDAGAKGQDLVADMVRRLKRDIMAATNRLDAMRSTQ
ncbi:MAG: hypothetical protein ABIT71_00685 [Vicinamibacteraceae bacterium]